MKNKTILLTLLFAIGFSFQDCNIDDCGPFDDTYFNVEGLELLNFDRNFNSLYEETIAFDNYDGLHVILVSDYHVSNYPKQNKSFSLFNSAYACSPPPPGGLGSKTEKLENITVITLNDFDNNHIAEDTLNDILEISINNQTYALNDYLAQNSSLLEEETFKLILPKAPELNDTFKVKVIVDLSTAERYELTSNPIQIIN